MELKKRYVHFAALCYECERERKRKWCTATLAEESVPYRIEFVSFHSVDDVQAMATGTFSRAGTVAEVASAAAGAGETVMKASMCSRNSSASL